jgi:hypothetical protein
MIIYKFLYPLMLTIELKKENILIYVITLIIIYLKFDLLKND